VPLRVARTRYVMWRRYAERVLPPRLMRAPYALSAAICWRRKLRAAATRRYEVRGKYKVQGIQQRVTGAGAKGSIARQNQRTDMAAPLAKTRRGMTTARTAHVCKRAETDGSQRAARRGARAGCAYAQYARAATIRQAPATGVVCTGCRPPIYPRPRLLASRRLSSRPPPVRCPRCRLVATPQNSDGRKSPRHGCRSRATRCLMVPEPAPLPDERFNGHAPPCQETRHAICAARRRC